MLGLLFILLTGFAITANANNNFIALQSARSCLQTSDESCLGSGHMIDENNFLLDGYGQDKFKKGENYLKVGAGDVIMEIVDDSEEDTGQKVTFVDLDMCDTAMYALRHPFGSPSFYAMAKRKLRVKHAWYCYTNEYSPGFTGAQELLARAVSKLLSSSDYVGNPINIKSQVETLTAAVFGSATTTYRTYLDHESHNMIAYDKTYNNILIVFLY